MGKDEYYKYSLLIVDSSKEDINLFYNIFKEEYKVYKALDSESAWQIISKKKIDIVIASNNIEKTSGFVFFERIKSTFPNIIRILTSYYDGVNIGIDGLSKGYIHRYITKPWDIDKLEELLEDVLLNKKSIINESQTYFNSMQELSEELNKEAVYKELDKEGLKNIAEYYEKIIRHIPSIVIVLDKNFNIFTANYSFYRFINSKNNYSGCYIGDILFQYIKFGEKILKKAIKGVSTFNHWEGFGLLYNSSVGQKIINIYIYESELIQGKKIYILIIDDITKNKKAEEEIKYLKEYNESIIQNINSGLIVTNNVYRIVIANKEAENILGYGRNELINLDIRDLFIVDSEDSINPIIETYESERSFQSVELKAIKNDQTLIPIGLSSSLHKNAKGEKIGLIFIFKDLTEIKKFHNLLIQTDKMAEIGLLAGGIAHEFNNLIGGMMGYAQLATITGDIADYKKCVEVVIKSSKRANEIISALLTFAKRDPVKMEHAEIFDIVNQTIFLLERDFKKQHIEIEMDIPKRFTIYTNVGKLQQVLFSIIRNAKDAMPNGGILSFKTYLENDYVIIEIKDTGVGIDKRYIDKIFYPFFTTKGSLGGSKLPGVGLDLAVSYSIIERLKGTISVSSTINQGTTFTIKLPTKATYQTEEIEPIEKGEIIIEDTEEFVPPKYQGNILIVDDEEDVVGALKKRLELDNHKAKTVKNGFEAIEMIKQEKFDIAIIDIKMPGIDGWETLKRLKAISPSLKAIMISGHTGDSLIEEQVLIKKSKALGAYTFLKKPFDLEKFQSIVNKLLNFIKK